MNAAVDTSVPYKDQWLLEMYYSHKPIGEIAAAAKVSPKYMKVKLKRLRQKYSLQPRTTLPDQGAAALRADEALVTALYLEHGLSIRQIAEKYNASHTTVAALLRQWGVLTEQVPNLDQLPSIRLGELPNSWADLEGETVLTVAKVPRFLLIPI